MSTYRPDRLSNERLLTPDRPKRELRVGQPVTTLDGNYKLMAGYVTGLAKADGLAMMHHSPDGSGPRMTAEYEATARLNPSREMLVGTLGRLSLMMEGGSKASMPNIDRGAVKEALRTMNADGMDDQSWGVLNEAVQFALRQALDEAGIDFQRMPSHQGFDFEIASLRAVESSRSRMKPELYKLTRQKVLDALGHLLKGSSWYYETQDRQRGQAA